MMQPTWRLSSVSVVGKMEEQIHIGKQPDYSNKPQILLFDNAVLPCFIFQRFFPVRVSVFGIVPCSVPVPAWKNTLDEDCMMVMVPELLGLKF